MGLERRFSLTLKLIMWPLTPTAGKQPTNWGEKRWRSLVLSYQSPPCRPSPHGFFHFGFPGQQPQKRACRPGTGGRCWHQGAVCDCLLTASHPLPGADISVHDTPLQDTTRAGEAVGAFYYLPKTRRKATGVPPCQRSRRWGRGRRCCVLCAAISVLLGGCRVHPLACCFA